MRSYEEMCHPTLVKDFYSDISIEYDAKGFELGFWVNLHEVS